MKKVVKKKKVEKVKKSEPIFPKYREERDIYVINEARDLDDNVIFALRIFKTIEGVAEFIGTKPYFIETALRDWTLHGKEWNSNIYYKRIDEDTQRRFIVVYKDKWESYSDTKRINRMNKLTD